MTRETKIGLLVGMAVIVLIGILISDHLSVAQQQQQAGNPPTPELDPSALVPPVFNEGAGGASQDVATNQPPRQPMPQALQPAPQPRVEPQPQPERRTFFPSPDVIVTPDVLSQNTTPGRRAEDDEDRTGTLVHVKPITPPTEDFVAVPQPRVDRATEDALRRAVAQAEAQPAPAPQPQPRQTQVIPAPPAPQHRFHSVKKGETLWAIASQYSDDPKHFVNVIYDANRMRMRSPGDVRAGVRLIIPSTTAVATTAVATPAPAPSPRPSAAPAAQPQPVAAPQYASYTTQDGDTLSELAQKFYGTSRKWRDLYELNRDVIANPDVVPQGVEIRVPKR